MIPTPVIARVAAVLAEYGTHTKIDRWIKLADAPANYGPNHNKEIKVTSALDGLNALHSDRALQSLGKMIADLMETNTESHFSASLEHVREWQGQIKSALGDHGLRYIAGGNVVASGAPPTIESIEKRIRERKWDTLEAEYSRAYEAAERDPEAALTAACAMLESFCQIYIEEEGLEMPKTRILGKLWPIVQKSLGLDPASKADDDIKQILQGMASVGIGVSHLRTHAGSAHGRGTKQYRIEPRHARLAIGASHTLIHFLTETWDSKRR